MNRLASIAEWIASSGEDVSEHGPYRVVRIRHTDDSDERLRRSVLVSRAADQAGWRQYLNALAVVDILRQKDIFLFYRDGQPYAIYVEGGQVVTGPYDSAIYHDTNPELYDILLSLFRPHEVDWRPDEVLPEDFYSS